MVQQGVEEEGRGFDGVREVAADFPGHYAGDGQGLGVWCGGLAVELGADCEEVGGRAPRGYGVPGHFACSCRQDESLWFRPGIDFSLFFGPNESYEAQKFGNP